MEKRKLASVQYVHHITPIEGADRIECVHVLGWQCVANKGQFKVGDHCVWCYAKTCLSKLEKGAKKMSVLMCKDKKEIIVTCK